MLDRWIGSYRLLERLGAGGMGEVYRAADTRLNRHVALKVLSPEHALRPHSVERFRREACSVAALNHPNIVTIYSVEEHEGLHFLTMELVQGKILSSLIPPEGLPLRRLLEIAAPLAEALEAAHERGIVHRDLKPANVMVNQADRVKVLDFGIAKSEPGDAATIVEGALVDEENLTGTGFVIGTPAYMSPEQALGRPVDHRTDIFSFGVLLYEMATGSRPFHGEAASETFAAVLRDTPPAPSSLNPRLPEILDNLIVGCLEKDAARRIQTARELRLSLRALSVGLSTPALSFPTQTGPLDRLRRRWGAPAAALAGTCCLVVTLAATRPRLEHFLTGPDRAAAGEVGAVAASRRPGLAVLPLGNFSKDPEYFVDGMTDALIASLSDIQGVRVISRQSVMRYKGSSESLPEIARELGVDNIVQGSVMRAGNRVRIMAQLIRAEPEQQLWARSYERDLSDVLSLQNEVARAISREIQVTLEPADQRRLAEARPVDPQAFDAYLKGRHACNQRTAAGFASALESFGEALRRDPKLAMAHAGMADVHSLSAYFGNGTADSLSQAREHALAALRLDPELADAHISLGLVQLLADRDWDKAEASFRRAIAASPGNATAHHFYSTFLVIRGRREEAFRQFRLVHELDPLSPSACVNLGIATYLEGHGGEALKLFEKALNLAPAFPSPYYAISGYHQKRGNGELSFEYLHQALSHQYAAIVPEMDRAYRQGGQGAALKAAADRLEELSRNQTLPPEDIARIYVRMGERQRAIDCLEQSYRRGFPGALMIGADSQWEWTSLAGEPRFRALVQRIGIPGPPDGGPPAGERNETAGCRPAPARTPSASGR